MLWWTLQQLKASKPETRISAARKLAESKENKAVPALVAALSDENAAVRIESARALAAIAHPGAIEAVSKALSGLSRKAKARRPGVDKGVEAAEYEALAAALGKQGPAAVTPLLDLLRSEDRECRRWSAHALGMIGDARAVAALAERLDDNRSEVRKAAAQALGEIRDPAALGPLKKALAARDPETRRVVVDAFGALGGESAAEALASAVEDEAEAVQLAAIEALSRIGGLRAGCGMRKAIEGGRKKTVVEAAAAALKSLRLSPSSAEERAAGAILLGDFTAAVREGQAASGALVEALASRDTARRRQAAEALGSIRAVAGIPPLIKALKDGEASVRAAAADALAAVGQPASEALIAALDSPDAAVQSLAARSLGRIGDARAARALADTIDRNRITSPSYPDSLQALRAAAEALGAIMAVSAGDVADGDLERIASVHDGMLEHPEGETEDARRPERVVDCEHLRELARKELERRGDLREK